MRIRTRLKPKLWQNTKRHTRILTVRDGSTSLISSRRRSASMNGSLATPCQEKRFPFISTTKSARRKPQLLLVTHDYMWNSLWLPCEENEANNAPCVDRLRKIPESQGTNPFQMLCFLRTCYLTSGVEINNW